MIIVLINRKSVFIYSKLNVNCTYVLLFGNFEVEHPTVLVLTLLVRTYYAQRWAHFLYSFSC